MKLPTVLHKQRRLLKKQQNAIMEHNTNVELLTTLVGKHGVPNSKPLLEIGEDIIVTNDEIERLCNKYDLTLNQMFTPQRFLPQTVYDELGIFLATHETKQDPILSILAPRGSIKSNKFVEEGFIIFVRSDANEYNILYHASTWKWRWGKPGIRQMLLKARHHHKKDFISFWGIFLPCFSTVLYCMPPIADWETFDYLLIAIISGGMLAISLVNDMFTNIILDALIRKLNPE